MEHFDKEFCLEVWGPMACFTRPELKVERVSYDVITPSAARAIFEAIFWKPAIRWEITRIEVLNPIKWTSIRRNELKFSKKESFYIENERTQRNTLLLKDVRYRIFAKMVFIPLQKRIKENPIYQSWFDSTSDSYKSSKNPIIDSEEIKEIRKDENPAKYNAIFERRARKGQYFKQPYLGTREFPAFFKYVENVESIKDNDQLNIGNQDFGIMFFDWDFSNIVNTKTNQLDYKKSIPLFFRAKMNNGVIIVPLPKSKDIIK